MQKSKKHLYLCGPMTHIPRFNFPLFDAAARELRHKGYTVTSPAELDSPAARKAAMASSDGSPDHYAKGDSWGKLLARDVQLIADDGIEAMVVLPGWERSRGARLETFVGRLCGLPVLSYPLLQPVTDTAIQEAHGLLAESKHPVSHDPRMKWVSGVGWTLEDAPNDSDPDPTGFYQDWPVRKPKKRYVKKRYVPDLGETEIVNEKTGGRKGSKAERYDLLPFDQLDEVARLYAFGAQKYEPNNWRRGYDWSLSIASLFRHMRAFCLREEIDPETQCHHLASVVFHALALMYFANHHPELDDRCRI